MSQDDDPAAPPGDPDEEPEKPVARRIPRQPLRPSSKDRHQLDLLDINTRFKDATSALLPGLSLVADLDLINQGRGEDLGNNRWAVNNRIYVDKGDGKAYPESGEGVVLITRPVLKAIQMLIGSGGSIDNLYERTRRDPQFHAQDDRIRQRAIELYALIVAARGERL